MNGECRTALKEWASVIHAFGTGEQAMLVRKGGLVDTAGFELAATRFVFYPTFEHQTVNFLRPEYVGYLEQELRHRPSEGQVRIEWGGEVIASTTTTDATVLKRLASSHIYNDAFLEQRLRWQPEQPLVIALVRAFRLPAPQIVPALPQYGGCKSWVDLEQPVSLEGATAALEDAAFARHARALEPVLGRVEI